MSELVDKFIEARFEKKANPPQGLLDRLSGAPQRKYQMEQLTPELKRIRAAIESASAKQEELLRRQLAAGRYAQEAKVTPPAPGVAETALNMFPTVAATTAAGTAVGSMLTPQRLSRAISQQGEDTVRKSIINALAEQGVTDVSTLPKSAVGMAHALYGSGKYLGLPMRLLGKLPWFRSRFGHRLPETVSKEIINASRTSNVRQTISDIVSNATTGKSPLKLKSPWLGAGLGALVGLSPSLLNYYWRQRKAKGFGGVRALEAHEAVRRYARQAEAVRRWQEAQMAQLDSGEAPSLIPFSEFQQQIPNIRFGAPTTP